jgi:hypothetical protein
LFDFRVYLCSLCKIESIADLSEAFHQLALLFFLVMQLRAKRQIAGANDAVVVLLMYEQAPPMT